MATLTAKPWPLQTRERERSAHQGVNPNPTVLVADLHGLSGVSVASILSAEGVSANGAATVHETMRNVYDLRPEAVIVCVGPRSGDDLRLIERIREICDTPVIAIGGATGEATRLAVFQAGADDHLDGVVSSRELLARLHARLRRTHRASGAKSEIYSDPCLVLDVPRVEVTVHGHGVSLSPTEFRLLRTLVRNAGSVLSPEQLLDACWSADGNSIESVRVYIGYLRRKLRGSCPHGDLIETVRGFGYRYAIR